MAINLMSFAIELMRIRHLTMAEAMRQVKAAFNEAKKK
jgi:hypothetical protein